jgi:hypothetical protein
MSVSAPFIDGVRRFELEDKDGLPWRCTRFTVFVDS